MANRATITYNGKTISTEDRDGSFAVTYNGSTLATLGTGQSKTINCSGQPMKSDIVVGGKTLRCKNLKMHTDVGISVVSLFPSAPSSYSLLGTYTSSTTFTAPKNGYYEIEAQGASGNGGAYLYVNSYGCGGGGGGGGGCARSRIEMNKGDTAVITVGGVGATTKVVVNSSRASYSALQVTSGANGGNAYTGPHPTQDIDKGYGGAGGAGGVASGGNYANHNGGSGAAGLDGNIYTQGDGGAGGSPGYSGGRSGGNGGTRKSLLGGTTVEPTSGSAGFVKIYAGNTNA